jgi:superfamily II DNA helicase RecQ
VRKQYQIVIVSLEILNNDSRFEDLWGTKRFIDNLVNLVLDEAHVVKEWGGTFCSDYLQMDMSTSTCNVYNT